EMVRRDESHWVATVRAEAPEIQYYIAAGDQPVFATETWPHTVPVHLSEESERRSHDLVRSAARRSRIHASYEYVDFGKRGDLADHYYRVDADFSYRLWTYPLEDIRVGYTRLLGNQMCDASQPMCEAGFKVGGWFELGLAAVEGIRLDVRGIVIASKQFEPGGR